jgi:serine/threonine protein kinase
MWKRFHIGKYKVLERIGAGGMGLVFLCEHQVMRRRVAVKVLPTVKAGENAARERFEREARVVANLDHPNLVRAYDSDKDGELRFLVMEYVDGSSLQEIVKRHGPMDVTRACHYVRQAADGLDYAFRVAELIHRDVKPANILVDRGGTVKILDMGLARFFNDNEDILTKKYDETVLGTADYLAPEQAIDSHGVDIRADIYGLGCTFYFVLTGRAPFEGGSVAQKLIWHQSKQPRPIREIRPDVPAEVARVVEKMMAKDPAGRYQTPAELAAALEPLTRTPVGPPPEAEMPRLSRAAMTGAGSSGTTAKTVTPRPSGSNRLPAPPLPAYQAGSNPFAEALDAQATRRGSRPSVYVTATAKAAAALDVRPAPAHRVWWAVIGVVVVVLAGAAVVYWLSR